MCLDPTFSPWGDPKKENAIKEVRTVGKEHGRIEIRKLEVSPCLKGYLDWPEVEQVMKATLVRTISGKTTETIVYGITSLSPEEASPTELLNYWRSPLGNRE